MGNKKTPRYAVLDSVRGFTILNMIVYHTIWDIFYMYGINLPWFDSAYVHIWQQAICISFIFISGFCWSFSRHKLKRALVVLSAGALVTYVTTNFLPSQKIIFGVLTLIGSSMLIMIVIDKLIKNKRPLIRFFLCILLFIFTKNAMNGYLSFGNYHITALPQNWYNGLLSAFLGFKPPNFASADYFPLIPWIFIFMSGYFMHKVFCKNQLLKYLKKHKTNFLDLIGRHSLIIYLLHQPIIYSILWAIGKLI